MNITLGTNINITSISNSITPINTISNYKSPEKKLKCIVILQKNSTPRAFFLSIVTRVTAYVVGSSRVVSKKPFCCLCTVQYWAA